MKIQTMACQFVAKQKLVKLKLIAATLRVLSFGRVTIFRPQVLCLHLSVSLYLNWLRYYLNVLWNI